MYYTFPSYYCLNTCSAGGNYVRARTVDTRLFLHLPRAWVRGYPSVYLPYILPTNKASSHSMELWGLYFSTCCLRFSTCVNFVLCLLYLSLKVANFIVCNFKSELKASEIEYGSWLKHTCVVSPVHILLALKRWSREPKCSKLLPTTTNLKFNLRRVQWCIVCLPSN